MKVALEIQREVDEIGDWMDVNKGIFPDTMTFNQMVVLIDGLIDIYEMNDARKNICDCVQKMHILFSMLENEQSFH